MKYKINRSIIKMFAVFSLIGVINTLADIFIFHILCGIIGLGRIISNIFSYSAATSGSYLLNSKLVYGETGYSKKQFFTFILVNTFVLAVSTVLVILLSDLMGKKTAAKICSVPITAPLNFILQRYFVFNKEK